MRAIHVTARRLVEKVRRGEKVPCRSPVGSWAKRGEDDMHSRSVDPVGPSIFFPMFIFHRLDRKPSRPVRPVISLSAAVTGGGRLHVSTLGGKGEAT